MAVPRSMCVHDPIQGLRMSELAESLQAWLPSDSRWYEPCRNPTEKTVTGVKWMLDEQTSFGLKPTKVTNGFCT